MIDTLISALLFLSHLWIGYYIGIEKKHKNKKEIQFLKDEIKEYKEMIQWQEKEKTKDLFNYSAVKLVANDVKQYASIVFDNASYVEPINDKEFYFICYNSANLLYILQQLNKTYTLTISGRVIEVVINE